MKKAPIPQNEKERLRALRSHRIDYAEIDFAFDQITKIAAQMMGVSTSLISFIEEDTNFIKSGHGTDASSVPREISVCGHTLVEKEVMILDNIPGDERFHDNPILVGDNPVNFYIGKAIIDKNGFAIGTLCAFGEEKIQPTSDQINAFESLANHIIHLVELNKKKNEASELHLQSMQIQKIAKTGGWELDVASGKTEWTEEVYKIHKVDFGTPTDKIQGIEFYAESERPKLVNYIQRCVEFAERFDDEFEFYDSEGEKKWVRSIGEPVLNSKGKVEKLVGVFQDLTELKNVIEIGETATKELEKFFDVGLDFLCIANQEGYFTKINPAFSKTLGYSDEVILSTPIVDFVHPDDIQATLAEFESLGQGHQTISFQNRYKHRDGHFIYLDWKASPDNETGKIYAAARNVTEQVHEKQLKAAISEIRKSYISYKDKPSTFFDFILSKILELTESEYGFIGEIKESSEGKPFLKTYSITNIAWNDETKKFYEQNAPDGMEFTNLETLFGHTLRTGGPIITNSPMNHPASGGLPKGHPDLNAYMGIPIYSNNRMIAMAGIANRSLGYSSEYFDFLQPLISVLGETIKAYQLEFELRKTEDLNAHYKMALDKAAIVAFTDTKGNITYANELFCKVSGYDIDELIGQNHRLLKSGVTSDETFKDLWKTISSGEIWEGEICNRKKDGSLYWLDTVIVPYKNKKGKIEHYMAIRNDVTAFKQKQQELDQALVKAEAAAIAKSDFLSTMSHEIRTPLNGIIGMTSLLMDTELSGEQHEFVGSISTSGSALLMIVNDILDFSKIESGKIEFEKVQFNYRHLLEELVLPFEYEAKKKKLTFVNKVEYIDHA